MFRWLSIALVVVCCLEVPAGAGFPPQNEAAQHAAQAAAASQRRDFPRAEAEWKKVLSLDPGSSQALHNLGMVYYLERKYPEAEEMLRKALRADPSLANARVLLGASLARQGKAEQATKELENALKNKLNDSAERTARLALHEAWVDRGDYNRALGALKPLAEKYPEDVDILYHLGQTYLQLSQQSFLKIPAVDPGSYRIHQIIADSLAKQKRPRDAIEEYRLALEKEPNGPGVHYQIGLLYLLNDPTSQGVKAAQGEFEAELKLNPYDAWTEYRLGQVAWKQRERDSSAAHFRRALELDRSLVPARLALARALEEEGKLDEALQQLELARSSDPSDATTHYRLAGLYRKRGDEAAAEQEMKEFQRIRESRQEAQRELEKTLQRIAEPGLEGEDDPAPQP